MTKPIPLLCTINIFESSRFLVVAADHEDPIYEIADKLGDPAKFLYLHGDPARAFYSFCKAWEILAPSRDEVDYICECFMALGSVPLHIH